MITALYFVVTLSFCGLLLSFISPRLVNWLVPGTASKEKSIGVMGGVLFASGLTLAIAMMFPAEEQFQPGAVPVSSMRLIDLVSIEPLDDPRLTQMQRPLGCGLTRDFLIGQIHSWIPDFPFDIDTNLYALGCWEETVVGLCGPPDSLTQVFIIMGTSPAAIFDTVNAAIFLSLAELVAEESRAWVEQVACDALACGSYPDTIQDTAYFDSIQFAFVYRRDQKYMGLSMWRPGEVAAGAEAE